MQKLLTILFFADLYLTIGKVLGKIAGADVRRKKDKKRSYFRLPQRWIGYDSTKTK